jgi:murein DD-endopeptidase MepM/ murein hydrolase activator NlpD
MTGLWSLVSAAYLAFREELLARLIAYEAEMQASYESRIADLRAQVERLTSRRLLDQEQFEQKLAELVRRQVILESRAAALAGVPDPSANPAKPQPPREANPTLPLRPRTSLDSDMLRHIGARATSLEDTLAWVKESLDRVELHQTAVLGGLAARYDAKAKRIQDLLSDLGLDVARLPAPRAAAGGPFVPVAPRPEASAFERQLHRIELARAEVDRLKRTLAALPIRKPLAGEIDLNSGFGVRIDPFLRTPAMHTGVDFRGNVGDPVYATAAGRVVQAGWNSGYGRMVEIDHGNGLSTRYAHLSVIEVEEGETVRVGQVVGRVGSTGRSTGPHLHYETRVEGEPVDPQKFLRAATRIGAL